MTDVVVETKYETTVVVTGGRVGRAESVDGLLKLDMARPGSKAGTNPEQALAAGWGACFISTMAAVAREQQLDASDARVDAHIVLGKTDEGFFALKARLDVRLPHLSTAEANSVMESAHQRCPYSRALRDSIEIELKLLVPGHID